MNDPGTSSPPPPPPRRLVFRPQPRSSTPAITTTAATRTAPSRPRTAIESTFTATTTTTTTTTMAEEDVADADATYCLGVIVMLHGWAQNVDVFSNRTKKFIKRLTQAGYSVVFVQAPHRLPPLAEELTTACTQPTAPPVIPHSREYAYAWFLYDDVDDDDDDDNDNDESNSSHTRATTKPTVLPSPTGTYRGMEHSLWIIHEELTCIRRNEEGRYYPTRKKKKIIHNDDKNIWNKKHSDSDKTNDIILDDHPCSVPSPSPSPPVYILGFSQGAVLVHKIATLVCYNDNDDDDDMDDGHGNHNTNTYNDNDTDNDNDNDDDNEDDDNTNTNTNNRRMKHNTDCDSTITTFSLHHQYRCCWKDRIQKCILVSGFSFTAQILKDDNTSGSRRTLLRGMNQNINTSHSHSSTDNATETHGAAHVAAGTVATTATAAESTSTGTNSSSSTPCRTAIMPSLHVWGLKDDRVRPQFTKDVYLKEPCFGLGCFDSDSDSDYIQIWEHPRGHVVPQDRNFCNHVLEFLSR